MKPLLTSLTVVALTATAGMAMASSGSLVQFKPKVMPVIVQVNAQGKVTDINPSQQLPPKLQQLLFNQLDAWIVKPAMVKGHPVASRFIAEVALQTTDGKNGSYEVKFAYVKSLPMPPGFGAVYWDHINGGLELALVSQDGVIPNHRWRMRYDNVGYPANSPAAARAMRSAALPRRSTMPTPASRSRQTPSAANSRLVPQAFYAMPLQSAPSFSPRSMPMQMPDMHVKKP